MRIPRIALSLFALIALVLLATPRVLEQRRVAARALPMPTEHRLDSDAERLNRKGRRAYIAEMHAAAEGFDWQAIERENGLALMAARASMLRETDDWNEIGSRDQAGRMHTVALSLAGDSLYAGSSLGGVWKADVNGNGWRPLSDNLFGGSHDIVVAGGAPEVVTTMTDGGDIHYTEDGGATWTVPGGIPAGITIGNRLLTDPSDTSLVYLLIRVGNSLRLFRSDDAGRSYAMVHQLSMLRGDIWLDRVNGGRLYLQDWQTLHVSDDHGETFQQRGTVSFFGTNGVVLVEGEAGAPTLYSATKIGAQWELHRSLDAGFTWEFRYDINDFWESLCASIGNPEVVTFAGVEAWRSPNGGANFFKCGNWWDYYSDPLHKMHADFPGIDCLILPGQGETFFCNTDGGIFQGNATMTAFTNICLEGLGVSQYYDIHTSAFDPNRLLAGAQDQGYQRSEGPGRGPSWPFDQLISGDYAHLTSGDGGQDVVFSVYPGFVLIQQGSDNPVLYQADFPAGESYLWLPPIVANPENNNQFYFCARRLYLGTWNGGGNVTYQASAQLFTEQGGAYLAAFSISPVDGDIRLAVTNTGVFWYSHDGGANWDYSSDPGPGSHYFHGTDIVQSHTDPMRAWAGGSGYSNPAVYRTDDGGVNWVPDNVGMPVTLVHGLAIESPAREALYAATESGPYRLDMAGGTWSYIGGTEAPLTNYWCVEAVPAAQSVRFGTYGRGIWEYAVSDLTAAAGELPAPSGFALANHPNPFNPKTSIRFVLAAAGRARLSIHDVRGRELVALVNDERSAGEHSVDWDGRDARGNELPSAVYLARVESGGESQSLRLTLIR